MEILKLILNCVRFFLFVLIVCFEVFIPLEIFHSYGDVTMTGEGLQILTDARHSWPLSTEGFLGCHTYCDTGHLCMLVISEEPWHATYCRPFGNGAVNTCFTT